MNTKLNRRFLILLFSLFLMSSFALAQQQAELVFPEIEGWEKGERTKYPAAELGYSIPYRSEAGGIVTIYVYNGGLESIGNGVLDKNVIAEIRKAENDIKMYGDEGYYQDVKLIKNETVTLGGASGSTRALYSLFSFKVRDIEVDSEIYLFGYQNQFIKFRTTRQKGPKGPDNPEVNRLLSELGKMFAK